MIFNSTHSSCLVATSGWAGVVWKQRLVQGMGGGGGGGEPVEILGSRLILMNYGGLLADGASNLWSHFSQWDAEPPRL